MWGWRDGLVRSRRGSWSFGPAGMRTEGDEDIAFRAHPIGGASVILTVAGQEKSLYATPCRYRGSPWAITRMIPCISRQ